jgi:hypothetical protein
MVPVIVRQSSLKKGKIPNVTTNCDANYIIYSLSKYFAGILYLMYLSSNENLGGCGSRVGLLHFAHFSLSV